MKKHAHFRVVRPIEKLDFIQLQNTFSSQRFQHALKQCIAPGNAF